MAIQSFWEERGLYLRMTGAVSFQDLIESILELTGHERADEIRYVVDDWSDVAEISIPQQNVSHIISFCKVAAQTNARLSKAIVIPSDERHKPLFEEIIRQMEEQLPWRTKLFPSEEAARSWLAKTLKFDLPSSPKTNPNFLNDQKSASSFDDDW